MSRKTVLKDQDKMYLLSEDEDGRLYLEVVTGGFAMEHLVLPLTENEHAQYREVGKPFVDNLSYRMLKNRKKFESRLLDEG